MDNAFGYIVDWDHIGLLLTLVRLNDGNRMAIESQPGGHARHASSPAWHGLLGSRAYIMRPKDSQRIRLLSTLQLLVPDLIYPLCNQVLYQRFCEQMQGRELLQDPLNQGG